MGASFGYRPIRAPAVPGGSRDRDELGGTGGNATSKNSGNNVIRQQPRARTKSNTTRLDRQHQPDRQHRRRGHGNTVSGNTTALGSGNTKSTPPATRTPTKTTNPATHTASAASANQEGPTLRRVKHGTGTIRRQLAAPATPKPPTPRSRPRPTPKRRTTSGQRRLRANNGGEQHQVSGQHKTVASNNTLTSTKTQPGQHDLGWLQPGRQYWRQVRLQKQRHHGRLEQHADLDQDQHQDDY